MICQVLEQSMSEPYKLYGAEFSLYSGKARSYLRKKGVPFEEITSTLSVYKNFIIPRTGVRYIPVVQTPEDEVFQDTTVIIDEMEKRFPEHSVYPATPKQKLAALLLEVYADEWLVIPAMHYRWNYPATNSKFIYGEFGSMVLPNAPGFIQRFVGKKVGNKFKGFVPKLGIHEHNIPALENSYVQLLDDLQAHFEKHDYLLGAKPCIADFGFIAPLYAHLYRDPAPGKLMRAKAPAVCDWVKRMINTEPGLQSGELLANDEIPTTLMPVLRRMASEHLPVLLDTDSKLDQWRKDNADKSEIDRFIGMHNFEVEGVAGERLILPYALWMFQRPVDYYHELEEKIEVDTFLQEAGFGSALQRGLKNRLARPGNILKFA